MKTKYLALLVAAMGSGLSFGASIDGLDAAYSKNLTAYNGTTGDVLNVSSPTTLGVNANGSWTMAFTISDLGVTPGSNVGLLFTYNTGSYKNLEGLGFQLTESGTLTLCAGGFAYNGNPSASSSWENANVFRLFHQHPPGPCFTHSTGEMFPSPPCWGTTRPR